MFFSGNAIITDDKMMGHIKRTEPRYLGLNGPNKAIVDLRSVVDVFSHMQEPETARIFKNEKIRIGSIIDGIDKTLGRFPREPRLKGSIVLGTYAPWQPLHLGPK
jgi:hypothetical protein